MIACRPAALGAALILFAFLMVPVTAAPAPQTKPTTVAGSPRLPEKKVKDQVGRKNERKDRSGLYEFESGAYKIRTDVDKDLANDIAAHMDEVYKEYDRRFRNFKDNPFAAVRPTEKMPLYVLRRYKDYVTLLRTFGVNAENSGGVFFRTAQKQSGLATWVEGQSRLKMYYVLQHEGFHQFADARIMFDLPPWVNEGLAEYFGDSIMVKGQLVDGKLDASRIERMKAAIKNKETLPFKELLTMDGKAWVGRVTGGDKAASLMYDSAWSVCYFLIHGGKRNTALQTKIDGQLVPALEAYLRILNANFVKDPRTDKRPEAFAKVFSNELNNFEAAWKEGLGKLEPDPWFSSVRHLQFVAAGLKQFHAAKIEINSWPHLKEQMTRHRFRTTIRQRDANAAKGDANAANEPAEADPLFDFPAPAEVEFVPAQDPSVPAGFVITKVTPNIVLSWSVNRAGEVEEDIRFIEPSNVRRPAAPVAKKNGKENPAGPEVQNAAPPAEPDAPAPKPKPKPNGPTTRKGTIKVGP